MNTLYLRYELVRLLRNRQNFVFSLIFPVVLYLFIAGQNRNAHYGSLSLPTYFMAGMIAFGGMGAVFSGGARIAMEREAGWTRQLRISPLSPRAYFQSKVIGSYLMASITIAMLYVAGIALGVRMPLARWLEMTGLILVSLIPFAAAGVMIGHLIKSDSMGPVMGGGMSLLSIAGGAFGQIGADNSVVRDVTKFIPTYWIVQAGRVAIDASAWGVQGAAIVTGWSVLAIYGAVWAYRRDTARP